jgi:hypothetical protein
MAEKASGKASATPAFQVHQALYNAADAAQKAGNPERMRELWTTQQAFTKESGEQPSDSRYASRVIHAFQVHEALYNAADAAQKAGNPEHMLELWTTQQAFATESKTKPLGLTEVIYTSAIHQVFSLALDKETDNQRIVSLYETWLEFEMSNRPDSFKAKYGAAKIEVEKARI